MISTNNFHTGLTIELEGTVYQVEEFQHSKSGRGGAFVRTKLRNLEENYTIEKTFRAGEKVERAHIDSRKMQFLYREREKFIFMDKESYEQIEINEEKLGERVGYLQENMDLEVDMYQGQPLDIKLPTFVELEVADTQPTIKGNTVSGGSKPATMTTGLVVQVPLFVEKGDKIKIDTRKKEYIERV